MFLSVFLRFKALLLLHRNTVVVFYETVHKIMY